MKLSNNKNHIIDYLVEYLKENIVGKENSMLGNDIKKAINKEFYANISSRDLREMISIIRSCWLIDDLIAGTKGYFIATKKSDVNQYLDRLKGIITKTQIIIDSFDNENILDPGTSFKKNNYNDDY